MPATPVLLHSGFDATKLSNDEEKRIKDWLVVKLSPRPATGSSGSALFSHRRARSSSFFQRLRKCHVSLLSVGWACIIRARPVCSCVFGATSDELCWFPNGGFFCFFPLDEDGGLLVSSMLCPLAVILCSRVCTTHISDEHARSGGKPLVENRQVTEHSEPAIFRVCVVQEATSLVSSPV